MANIPSTNGFDYPNSLATWKFWCQKVIPLVYDNSLSYYEVLCKVVEMCNDLIIAQNQTTEILKEFGIDIQQLQSEVAQLQTELERIKNGDYMSEYINALAQWIDNNLQTLVARIVKYVSFGLSQDGHFVAYIPPTWNFIQFDTVYDPTSDLYGHLILRW